MLSANTVWWSRSRTWQEQRGLKLRWIIWPKEKPKKMYVYTIHACLRRETIMTGAIFQIRRRNFSLPGGLGSLHGGRHLPEQLLGCIAGCSQLHFPFQKVRNQRGLEFHMVLPSHAPGKRSHWDSTSGGKNSWRVVSCWKPGGPRNILWGTSF